MKPKFTYYLKDAGKKSPLARRLGIACTRDARLEYDRLGYRHIKRDDALRCLRDPDQPCVVTIDMLATSMTRRQVARALKDGKPIFSAPVQPAAADPSLELLG
jgi:hypothetical protein